MTEDQHDELRRRCSMLGHPVPFKYCRQVADGLPCRRTVGCWEDEFDILAYLQEHFTPEQLQTAFAPPKPKMVTLVELIEQAQQRQKDAKQQADQAE